MRLVACLVVAAFVSPATVPGEPMTQALTLDERVAAQKAIEQVYWNHRVWPKENPAPKPLLSAAMSDEAIRAKVEDSLRKSSALEKYWKRPITAEQLQAEMDRMAKHTRDGRFLSELFAALRNDPALIAETLARASLADRLIHNWYAFDRRFHGVLHDQATAALDKCRDAGCMSALGGAYRETAFRLRSKRDPGMDDPSRPGEIVLDAKAWDGQVSKLAGQLGAPADALPVGKLSTLEETADAFVVTAVLAQRNDAVTTATVTWPKVSFDAWWPKQAVQQDSVLAVSTRAFVLPDVPDTACQPDTWRATPIDAPDPRAGHTAVWTGTEMLVWGEGETGLRYSAATDTWKAMALGVDAALAHSEHAAVWTGTELIVWGGYGASGISNTGGRYDPATDSWTATAMTAGVPPPRTNPTAVWTGTEMIVWGGSGFPSAVNTGGRYNPSTDSWAPTSIGANVPSARSGHTAVWTGSEMIVWGGSGNTGGRYNPSLDSWTPTSIGANVPVGRHSHTAVWTGTAMIVWGGQGISPNAYLQSGGRYAPSTNTWTPTSTGANVPAIRYIHTAVWTGTEMIVWGGQGLFGVSFNSGGRYNPATNTWTPTSLGANVPAGRYLHSVVWTGSEMIVWSGLGFNAPGNSGGRYDPSTNTWVPTSTGGATPVARESHSAVWTGTQMIVWGGTAGGNGARYTPAIDNWSAMAATGAPSARSGHNAVWTGSEMILWGGGFNTGGRYDPTADSWLPTSTIGAPSARTLNTATWSGHEMLVWGGTASNAGGRYDPATDTWTPMSTTGAPLARTEHSAVWTGTELVVWGGQRYNPVAGVLRTGGRYRPSTDSWTATSLGAGVPAARYRHAAVWTGHEMIVLGGNDEPGGRYDPATDAWGAAPTTVNEPEWRESPAAHWTGTEMIVWGGVGSGGDVNTGGRYDPAADAWQATSVAPPVPSPREKFGAVWTGSQMIVWGGSGSATGGLYCVASCASPAVFYQDADGDGFGNPTVSVASCTQPDGYAGNGDDCDDTSSVIHPGTTFYRDADGDGYGDPAVTTLGCIAPPGYIGSGSDCVDSDPSRHPGAEEVCNLRDDDCDGIPDDSAECTGTCDMPDSSRQGLQLSASGFNATGVQMVWTGSEFATVWAQYTAQGSNGPLNLFFRRADANGVPVGTVLRVTDVAANTLDPSLVWTGSEYGVAWEDQRDGRREIYFVRIDAAGQVVPSEVRLTSASNGSFSPILVWNGSEYAISYSTATPGDEGDLYFRRIAADGTPIGAAVPISIAFRGQFGGGLVWNGSGYAIAWSDFRGGGSQVYLCRTDGSGTKLGGDVVVTNATDARGGALAWTGTEYGVTWSENDRLYFRRVSALGVPIGASKQFSVGFVNTYGAPLLWTGSEYGVVWSGQPSVQAGLESRFTRLSAVGDRLVPGVRVLPTGSEGSGFGALAWNGVLWGIAHGESTGNGSVEYLTLVRCGCVDSDDDGFTSCADCDDSNSEVFPGAVQRCDDLNRDCDDPGWPTSPASDPDLDGQPLCEGDCNAFNGSVYSGAPQLCDGVNNDCLNPSWPGLANTNESDDDGDGFTECAGDCDDSNPEVFPGAPQACDGLNNDCNDPTWPTPPANEADADLDDYRVCGGDCDDTRWWIRPYGVQRCDGVNNDCSDPNWPSLNGTNEVDLDGDSFSECAGDCDESDPLVNPGVADACGGVDYNCDRLEFDADHDGFTGCQNDCDDTAPWIHPGMTEQCNWIDDDCDGTIDGSFCDSACDPNGKLGNEVQITNQSATHIAETSRIAWNGSRYLALWKTGYSNGYLYKVLDRLGRTIVPEGDYSANAATTAPSQAAVAATSTMFGFAWFVERSHLKFRRLTFDGEIIWPDLTITPYHDGQNQNPAIAVDGSAFVLAWDDERVHSRHTVNLRRVSEMGELSTETIVSSSATSDARDPSIACGNSGCGLAWVDTRDGDAAIYFGRVDHNGGLVGSNLRVSAGAGNSPVVVWNGLEYAVFWIDGGGLWLGRVSELGQNVGTNHLVVPVQGSAAFGGPLSITWTGTEYRVVWIGSVNGVPGVFGGRLSSQGNAVAAYTALSSFGSAYDADSVWTGSESAAVWVDNRTGIYQYYFTRFGSSCADSDGDGFSTSNDCDDAQATVAPGAPELCDGRENDCRRATWPNVPANEADADADGFRICGGDNCPFDYNPSQSDVDHDGEGDRCDLDDGQIYVYATAASLREWQADSGFTSWNSYRGSLAVLRATGQYTQAPGSNPLAARDCGLASPYISDAFVPEAGEVAFQLVTGVAGGMESGLGTNSAGTPRPNTQPCP